MDGPPLSQKRPQSSSTAIPSIKTDSSTSSSASPFRGLGTSKISQKKPPGLSIRRAPSPPPSANSVDKSENDRLRRAIDQLALSSSSSVGSASTSPTAPTTPIHQSDSSSASGKSRKSTTKKKHQDKDGKDLVKDEDLEILYDLGSGNGGTVNKVWNKKRKCVMARKLILVDAKPSVRKQILRELQIMNDCDSPYIVGYYGCFPVDVHVGIAMEHMDAGSLDNIYRRNGPIAIDIVGKVAEAVLRGLMYLYDVHRIIHRDIKPSNILANTSGEIKICDFGVSGELINSIANTFVGTSTYMSPERIQGAPYTIKSDVWSLGISLIELALGRFPFSDSDDDYDPDPTLPLTKKGSQKSEKRGPGGAQAMSILDLLQHIVNEPAPRLTSPKREFPKEAVQFIDGCLDKEPTSRKSPQDLLASGWIVTSNVTKDDLKAWAQSVAPKHEKD